MTMAIIDHFHDDKPSLKACSLVCKAWTYPVRLHLFATSIIKWPLQPAAFPFVRHLRLRMHVQLLNGAPYWDNIFPLLIGFRRVVSLNIFLARLDSTNPQLWSTLGNNLPGVVSLSLSVSDLIFTNAFSLPTGTIHPRFHEFDTDRSARIRATICNDALSTPGLATLHLGILGALRTVCLDQVQIEDLDMCHKFIEALGNDLESLTLHAYMGNCMLPRVILMRQC
jgi:hypothetical protein